MWCRPEPFPRELRRLRCRDQACYANAARLAAKVEGLHYVEGFADPSLGGEMAFEHAWCVTPDRRVVDPTWDDDPPPAAFLGLPFSLDYRAQILRTRPRRFGSIRMLDPRANPSLLIDGLPTDALADPGYDAQLGEETSTRITAENDPANRRRTSSPAARNRCQQFGVSTANKSALNRWRSRPRRRRGGSSL
jgi:hypothetical protein